MVQVRLNRLQHALPRLDEDGFVQSIVSQSVSQSIKDLDLSHPPTRLVMYVWFEVFMESILNGLMLVYV